MTNPLTEIWNIAWGDVMFMKHNMVRVLSSTLMSPLLYLLAFGYGMGSGVFVDYEGAKVAYLTFVVPGIAALSSLSSSFGPTATRLNVQRLFFKNFDEMLMAPLRPSSVIIGKSMLGVFRGLMSCSMIFIVGYIGNASFSVTPLLIGSIALSCFMFSTLGVSAALLATSHQSMATFNSLVILPMTFLCGTFFSLDKLPDFFQYILMAMPLTHSSLTIRAAALDGTYPFISLGVMLAFTVVFLWLNLYLLRNKKI